MDYLPSQKNSTEGPFVKRGRGIRRSSNSIIGVLRASPKGISVEEIVTRRHVNDNIPPEHIPYVVVRTNKYLNRLKNEGRAFKGRQIDGTEVWSDELTKLEEDPDLDYYRLSIKELFKKYGKKKES